MVEKSQFVTDIERLLELKAGTLRSGDRLDSIGWDSLAVVSFIAHVDSKYGLSVAPERIEQAKTVDDLFAAVNA
jgi:acyl carrier protein